MNGHARVLTPRDGGRYEFDAGCFALETLLSGGPGAPAVFETASPAFASWLRGFELLHEPADLAGWVLESRLAYDAPLTVDELRIRPRDVEHFRDLRGALWAVAGPVARGGEPDASALEIVNAHAGPAPRPMLDPSTGVRRWATPMTGAQIVGAAARDAIEVFGGELADRVRVCGADDCHLHFLDTSRPGSRRWCSMRRCGNRHKVRDYRSRHLDA